MNNKGQTLILFVLLLPLLLLLMAFVIDTGMILKEKTKLDSTLRTVLKTTYKEKEEENYEERLTKLLEENEIPCNNMELERKENKIRLQIAYEKESIFGKIIGLNTYKIKSTMSINQDERIVKE